MNKMFYVQPFNFSVLASVFWWRWLFYHDEELSRAVNKDHCHQPSGHITMIMKIYSEQQLKDSIFYKISDKTYKNVKIIITFRTTILAVSNYNLQFSEQDFDFLQLHRLHPLSFGSCDGRYLFFLKKGEEASARGLSFSVHQVLLLRLPSGIYASGSKDDDLYKVFLDTSNGLLTYIRLFSRYKFLLLLVGIIFSVLHDTLCFVDMFTRFFSYKNDADHFGRRCDFY